MAAKIKKQEMERIMWQLKPILVEAKIDLLFQAYVKDKRKDPDNIYVMFIKFFLDALVKQGIIPNDGQKQIGRITLETVQIGEPRMEISLSYAENS
jgi:Holliday junction resolvase RusA-like endonuclease